MKPEALLDKLTRNQVAFAHEPVSNSRWWMLRTLPALQYLGIDHFTFPTSWRQLAQGGSQYDYLDYEYHVTGNMALPNGADLCVITNEHYETETSYSIEHLVNRFTSREGTLVVIADSPQFTPIGGQRPLYQEQFTERIGNVESFYEAFKQQYRRYDWDMPLIDTKNVFIQDNANLYELVAGDPLSRAEQLFDVLPDAPYLPLYSVFSDIFARPDEYGSVPLNTEDEVPGLGRWLRRRIEWDRQTSTSIARELNRAVSRDGSVFDPSYARRSPAMQNARDSTSKLDPQDNPIDARYQEFLTTEAL